MQVEKYMCKIRNANIMIKKTRNKMSNTFSRRKAPFATQLTWFAARAFTMPRIGVDGLGSIQRPSAFARVFTQVAESLVLSI